MILVVWKRPFCNLHSIEGRSFEFFFREQKCADYTVSDKKKFPTFIRTYPPDTQVKDCIDLGSKIPGSSEISFALRKGLPTFLWTAFSFRDSIVCPTQVRIRRVFGIVDSIGNKWIVIFRETDTFSEPAIPTPLWPLTNDDPTLGAQCLINFWVTSLRWSVTILWDG